MGWASGAVGWLHGAIRFLDHHEGSGVWIGSAASLLVAMVAVGVVFLQRALERHARRKSLGFSALIKLRAMHSDLKGLCKILAEWEANGQRHGLTEPHQFIWPVMNPPGEITFSPDEIEAMFSLGENKLFDAILLIEIFHNSALASLAECSARRRALTDLLPAESMKGAVGTVVMTKELEAKVGPRAVEISDMFRTMKEHWPGDTATAEKALFRLRDLLDRKLGLKVPLENRIAPIKTAADGGSEDGSKSEAQGEGVA